MGHSMPSVEMFRHAKRDRAPHLNLVAGGGLIINPDPEWGDKLAKVGGVCVSTDVLKYPGT